MRRYRHLLKITALFLIISTIAFFAAAIIKGSLGNSNSYLPRIAFILLITALTLAELLSILDTEKGQESGDRLQSSSSRFFYISALNVLAALFVVYLHTNGNAFFSTPRPKGRLWVTSNFIETFCYWPVPIFIMISGATLMEYRQRYETKIFLEKRFTKTVIPYLAWSLFACAFDVLTLDMEMNWNPVHIIQNIFTSNYMPIYWYFPVQFAIYLSMPLLSAVQNKLKTFLFTIVIGIITICWLPLTCSLLHINYNGALQLPVAGGYLIYTMLGYYLSRVQIGKRSRICIYLSGAAGWLLHFLGTIWISAGSDTLISTYKGYTNLPALLQAAAVFVFFRYLFMNRNLSEKFEKAVYSLANLTFGIYLIHKFLLDTIDARTSVNTNSIIWRLFAPPIIFAVSTGIIYLMKRIPGLKKLVP